MHSQIVGMSKKQTYIYLFLVILVGLFALLMASYLHHKTLLYHLRIFFKSSSHSNVSNSAGFIQNSNQNFLRFVAFPESIQQYRRLGNQIFSLAAILFVALMEHQ